MKKPATCLCILLLLASCAGESAAQTSVTPNQTHTPEPAPTVSYEEPAWGTAEYSFTKTDDKTGDTVMTVQYILPNITNEPHAPQWKDINEYYTAEGEAMMKNAEQTAEIAQEDYNYYKDSEFEYYPYTDEEGYEIKLDTERFVSILRTHYAYTGGVHGEVYLLSDTFDMTTGELLEMDDLFTVASSDYDERVLGEVKKLAAQQIIDYGESMIDESALESAFDHNCFYLTEDALVIYYQTYSLGCHALGAPEFSISREVLEDILIEW